jgi:acyl carrier protein
MSVEKIIADHLKIDISEVTDEKHIIEDLGGDSLHTVELVLAVENEYDITIPDEDAESLVTVGAIKQYISENA